MLDSGGFTELAMFGGWSVPPKTYVRAVRAYRDEIGLLQWAAPQDWMCEPDIIHGGGWKVGTHLSVADHQQRTVANFLELRHLAADLPIIPVLQGWEPHEYEACAELFLSAGVDLATEPVVGIGSVCRRGTAQQINAEIAIRRLQPFVGPMHGFGVSLEGLARYSDALGSSDSLAWSAWARRNRTHILDCDRPPQPPRPLLLVRQLPRLRPRLPAPRARRRRHPNPVRCRRPGVPMTTSARDLRYGRRGGGWRDDAAPRLIGRPCEVCGRPMLVGQKTRHYVCSPRLPCCGRPADLIGNDAAIARHIAAHRDMEAGLP